MKAISAAIIVLSAAVMLTGGSFIRHEDTKLFVQILGFVIVIAGMAGWYISLKER